MIRQARDDQELKNLKDYEAIRILQRVLPEATENAEDLPSAVTHFLNNPFEFLVYENPEAIPQDVREKMIEKNRNLLANDEKYVREVNILENQQRLRKAFNKNILHQEYINAGAEGPQGFPIDLKYFRLKRRRKKWYPEEIESKRRIEQLEYENLLAEGEESEDIGRLAVGLDHLPSKRTK